MNPKYPLQRNNSLGPYLNTFKTLRIRSLKSITPQINQLVTKRPQTRLHSPIKNRNKENVKNDDLILNAIDSSSIHFSYSPSSCKKNQMQKQTFYRKQRQPQKFDKKAKELCSIYLERPKSRYNLLFSSQLNQQIMRMR